VYTQIIDLAVFMSKILYEHIIEAKKYTKDMHWIDILDNCARNKFPKGAKYNYAKNMLYVRTDISGKLRTETLTLPTDGKGCYDTLMHVFNKLLSMKSDEDIKESKRQLEVARKKNDVDLDCDWKKLKPKTIKNHILMNYASAQIKEYGLNDKDTVRLYRLIQLGMQFKQLSSDDFEYENGVVYSIKGLEYDESKEFFVLTGKQGAFSHVSNNKVAGNALEKSVDKWIKEYNTHSNIKV